MTLRRTTYILWGVAAVLVILLVAAMLVDYVAPKAEASGEIGRYDISCTSKIRRVDSHSGYYSFDTEVVCYKIDTTTGSTSRSY